MSLRDLAPPPEQPEGETLARLYIEGYVDKTGERRFPSLKEMADWLGLAKETLVQKSSAEAWVNRRELHRRELEQQRQQGTSEEARRIAETALNAGVKVHHALLNQVGRYLQENRDQLDAIQLQRLSSATKSSIDGINAAVGWDREFEVGAEIQLKDLVEWADEAPVDLEAESEPEDDEDREHE